MIGLTLIAVILSLIGTHIGMQSLQIIAMTLSLIALIASFIE